MIRIDQDGNAQSFAGEFDLTDYYAAPVRARASHVEPVSLLPRLLFHLIRSMVRDDSMAARWTRLWPCRWRVRVLQRCIFGNYTCRADAIRAERRFLMTGDMP